MKAEFYTYFHTRNDCGKIFYVGKGRGKRAWSKRGRNTYWKGIAKKHGYTSHIASYWVTEDEAFDHEKLLISCLKEQGLVLVNMTLGGEGVSGHRHTQETKAKISAANSGNKAFQGRQHTPETKLKISLTTRQIPHTPEHNALVGRKGRISPRKGVVLSDETRHKLSIANSGKHHSPETIEKMRMAQQQRQLRNRLMLEDTQCQ